MSKSEGVGKGFGGGNKSKYEEEFNVLAYRFCLLGSTNKELAALFKVDLSTFNDWLTKYPKLRDSVFDGREGADAKVAEGLFKKATGYNYTESTEGGMSGGKTEHRVLHPDAGAAALWLKNRQRTKWADEKVVELKFTQELTDEELAERTKNLLDKANKKKPS